ncbi:hypothetical protein [Candidatus Contendibacter odensensis]|nr:hypothetical protein [Candidatus Contendobacter odensis]MBK8754079.1 hypothetical protein [Candidatus Competibacteraceae bacterium]
MRFQPVVLIGSFAGRLMQSCQKLDLFLGTMVSADGSFALGSAIAMTVL